MAASVRQFLKQDAKISMQRGANTDSGSLHSSKLLLYYSQINANMQDATAQTAEAVRLVRHRRRRQS
jgi:hypothetical protein